ncbi:unnamed protein product [Timema podura]|nr:unnamed protein product [Timema shepardi]CAD7415980.1 unnamed protein product [Timema cristinae]CAD7425298.1 unnamed protein product [Timema monikensis]CAD7444007.1 unnamed protein product [Timema bartmani]CAD7461586.1 unnamed protein product [Timema tahoe]CAD7581032.1 unnamed protein product [Timema californicum]CAG2065779.1 unnamed protein product [Timema podura]
MDSQVLVEGRLLDIVDNIWKEDKLPNDDISVPPSELPDPEADNGDPRLTLKQQEQKWTDLALSRLAEQNQGASN